MKCWSWPIATGKAKVSVNMESCCPSDEMPDGQSLFPKRSEKNGKESAGYIDIGRCVVYDGHIDNRGYEVDDLESMRDETVKVFKALCDPNRLQIVEMLQNGELCACQILEDLNIGQSTLSHHMKNLCESDVVTCRREGKWMYYSLNKKGCETAYSLLKGIMEASVQNNVDEKYTCE